MYLGRDKEGLEEITIPAVTITTCSFCKFYEHRMVKSGNHPQYREDCKHPDVTRASAFSDGNLPGFNERDYVETPDWCPYLKVKNDKKE